MAIITKSVADWGGPSGHRFINEKKKYTFSLFLLYFPSTLSYFLVLKSEEKIEGYSVNLQFSGNVLSLLYSVCNSYNASFIVR